MIESADEFHRLRTSERTEEYSRAAHDEASLCVWEEVIARWPDMRFWVAQNKTIPLKILEVLAVDPDEKVREMVARKRKLSEELQLLLTQDDSESVRRALSVNAKLSSAAVRVLAKDSVVAIRETIRERFEIDGVAD